MTKQTALQLIKGRNLKAWVSTWGVGVPPITPAQKVQVSVARKHLVRLDRLQG